MKKKLFISLSIILIVFIVVLIVLFNSTSTKIDFNTELKLSTTSSNLVLSNSKYSIDEISSVEIDLETEEKVLEVAQNITNAFGDVENEKYVSNIEKYIVRSPSRKIGDSFSLTNTEDTEYQEWYSSVLTIDANAWFFQSRSNGFKSIEGSVITYASSQRYIVQVYIDDFSFVYGSTEYAIDGIFEYEVIYEEISGLYKVSNMETEWVSDLEEYYQEVDSSERSQNKNNSSTLSNVSTYMMEGYTSFDYTKLEEVTESDTNNIYNKNKDSVVIIDSATENGVSAGSATGFYIRSGIIVTSYDSINSMIKNDAKRYYAVDTSDNIYEIEGVVASYPTLNVVFLKLKEEVGTSVTLGDSETLEENDPIAVISSSLGLKASIKLGIYFDTLDDDYKIIRTSLPLIDGDSGSAVFNMNGEVIAINTSVSTSDSNYNSGLNNAVDINIFKDVILEIQKEEFANIEVTTFESLENSSSSEVINDVSTKIWNKYLELPIITNYLPINLYSAYTSNNYLIVRYKLDEYSLLDNDTVISLYSKYLVTNSYTEKSNYIYEKDGITIHLKNNLGYIIVIVEGL